jgi:hypothetical protein
MSHRGRTYSIPLKKELVQQYRNVFSHTEAKHVLAHILFELGTFIDIPEMTPEDAALKNYGARLLNILGGGEVTIKAVEQFVLGLKSNSIPEDVESED